MWGFWESMALGRECGRWKDGNWVLALRTESRMACGNQPARAQLSRWNYGWDGALRSAANAVGVVKGRLLGTLREAIEIFTAKENSGRGQS